MDLVDYLYDQIEFSVKTFGPGSRTIAILDHIKKELIKIEEEPDELEEWIDVVMLGLDGAWRAGYTPKQIVVKLYDKLARNKQRTWPDWRTSDPNKAIEHEK